MLALVLAQQLALALALVLLRMQVLAVELAQRLVQDQELLGAQLARLAQVQALALALVLALGQLQVEVVAGNCRKNRECESHLRVLLAWAPQWACAARQYHRGLAKALEESVPMVVVVGQEA